MHEEEPRLFLQHVTVERGHLDAVARSALMTGFTSSGQDEVPGDRGFAAAGRLEVDGRRDPHGAGRSDLHAAFHDRVAARHRELIDAAVRLALDADDLFELRGIEVDGGGGAAAAGAVSGVLLSASAVRSAVASLTGSPCPPTCM